MIKDYYEILSVTRSATSDEIKKSYRRLALKYHPDVNQFTNSHKQFIQIQEAYEILINPHKRSVYDSLNVKSSSKTHSSAEPGKDDFYKWKKEATEKGREYSDMDYTKFQEDILDRIFKIYTKTKETSTEVYTKTKEVTENGCGLVFSFALFFGGLWGIATFIQQISAIISGEGEFHLGLVIGLPLSIVFIVIGGLGIYGLVNQD